LERVDSFKIPRFKKNKVWTSEQLENFRKNWPMLKHFDDTVLREATLSELSNMARQKQSSSKVLSRVLAANYETVRNFPVKVEAGEDDCTGRVHKARFLRGYVGDSQDLWTQAREHIGLDGLDPISNYETVSVGLGDLITPKVWSEVHRPSSKILSIRMLTPEARKSAWNSDKKLDLAKEFTNLLDLKLAVAALEGAIHKVVPWNMASKTLSVFLTTMDFGEAEFRGKDSRLSFLADFIDEVIRANAQKWDKRKPFLAAHELGSRWANAVLRKCNTTMIQGEKSTGQKAKKKKEEGKKSFHERTPAGVCKLFNEGVCRTAGKEHPAFWDNDYLLRHVCSKFLQDKRRFCMGDHSAKDHKN
jgi:hypothetical protein